MATKNRTSDYPEAVSAEDYYSKASNPEKLFDITCTVGSVYAGGDRNPRFVAFEMIAQHSEGHSGEYSFPNSDGTVTHVTVEESAS